MKIVYIAGAYRGADYLEIDRNIARARETAAALANAGIAYLCPHLNSAHFEAITPEVPAQWWLEMTRELMRRCDAIYVLDGEEESTGTLAEMDEALARAMPIFYQGDYGSELDMGEWDLLLEWAKS